MINENKIKSAAQAYCDATYGTLDNHPLIADAFKQGAKYAINEFLKDLWHSISEEPTQRSSGDIDKVLYGMMDGRLYLILKGV